MDWTDLLNLFDAHDAQIILALSTTFSLLSGLLAKWPCVSKLFGTFAVADLGRALRVAVKLARWIIEWEKGRRIVAGTGLLVLLVGLQGCSLEAARYRRAARSSFDVQVKMAQSARPVAQCQSWDTIHVWGDWTAGGLASVASGAGIVAAGIDNEKVNTAMLWTGVITGAASAVAVGVASQSAASWEAAGCGQ